MALFGDGSDGTVVLGINTSLTRDMFYANLTTGTFVLKTDGYRINVQKKLIVSAGGVIRNNGASGASGAAGGAGGVGAPIGSLPAGKDGGLGGINGVGTPGVASVDAMGGGGGAGGASVNAGGIGGTVTAPVAAKGAIRAEPMSLTGRLQAAGALTALNSGGGGGGGGGVLMLTYNSKTGSGTINAPAGAAGAGAGTGSPGVAGTVGTVVEVKP